MGVVLTAFFLSLAGTLAIEPTHAGRDAPTYIAGAEERTPADFDCIDTPERTECPDLDRQLRDGGRVVLPRGVYRQCAIIRKPTELDANGSLFLGSICRGKATFVQNADFVVRNAECAGVRGNLGNEACIRRQRGRTLLDNVHFHDSYSGILGGTGEPLILEDSVFENLGGSPRSLASGHTLYVRDGPLVIRNSVIRLGRWEGHLIKFGGALILIEGSVLDERGGNGSRVIDAFNGGEIVIKNTIVHAADNDGNANVIGFDFESRESHGPARLTLQGSKVDCAGGRLVAGRNSFDRLEVQQDHETILKNCR